MEQPQPLSRLPPLYVQSVPRGIVLGPYIISVRKVDFFEVISAVGYCTSLILDLPDRRVILPCHHNLQPGDSFKDSILGNLTYWFSTLGLTQDCVDRLVKEISTVVISTAVRNHISPLQRGRMVDVPYVSVSFSLETVLRVKRATEESIEALEMVGAAELEDYRDDSCTICFENLDSEMAGGIARMPCAHVYHKECVVEWLRTSHVCPLCRFEMPVMEASSSS